MRTHAAGTHGLDRVCQGEGAVETHGLWGHMGYGDNGLDLYQSRHRGGA
jgi:hypothetical protein